MRFSMVFDMSFQENVKTSFLIKKNVKYVFSNNGSITLIDLISFQISEKCKRIFFYFNLIVN